MNEESQTSKTPISAAMIEQKEKPAKVFHDFEKKPFLFILDRDLDAAASMLTDKDVKFMIRKAFNLLTWTYLKLAAMPRSPRVYEQIWTTTPDVIRDIFPGLDEKFLPKKMPPSKATEQKFAKMCSENFNLIADFCEAMMDEHVRRFGKPHKNERLLRWIQGNPPKLMSAGAAYVPVYPLKTIPFKYRDPSGDYFLSARRFYAHLHGRVLEEYRRVSPPSWLLEMVDVREYD